MKRSLLLPVAILILFVASARATSIEFGHGSSNNVFPFSRQYIGEYQQIYSIGRFFSQPFLISSIAFETSPLNNISGASYNFSLSLGVTDRTPSNPGSAYSGAFTPVFSGPLTVNYTTAGAFDFVVNFATPFRYDPSLGNLLMDIMINSPSSDTASFAASKDRNLGRVFNLGGTGPAFPSPNFGLDTRFSGSRISSVPDSSGGASLLGLGFVGLFCVRRVISLQQRV